MDLGNGYKNVVIYRFVLLFVFCSSYIVSEVSAQYNIESSFSDYSSYLSKVMDISWKIPKNFIWEGTKTTIWSQGNWGSKGLGALYCGMMKSNDGDCIILYPDKSCVMLGSLKNSLQQDGDPIFARRQMIYDMSDALKKELPLYSISPDLEKYVITLVGKDVPFNADTVFIAQIPLKKTYQGKYTYCTALYVSKQNRPSMIFRCFFTDKGKLNEKKYLARFCRAIKYKRKKCWVYDNEKEKKVLYELYLRSVK